jgi:hypothetical protein
MTQTARKQRLVVGRIVDGELQIIADVVPFVSSRLGNESVSRETKQEHDEEQARISDALAWREGSARR